MLKGDGCDLVALLVLRNAKASTIFPRSHLRGDFVDFFGPKTTEKVNGYFCDFFSTKKIHLMTLLIVSTKIADDLGDFFRDVSGDFRPKKGQGRTCVTKEKPRKTKRMWKEDNAHLRLLNMPSNQHISLAVHC